MSIFFFIFFEKWWTESRAECLHIFTPYCKLIERCLSNFFMWKLRENHFSSSPHLFHSFSVINHRKFKSMGFVVTGGKSKIAVLTFRLACQKGFLNYSGGIDWNMKESFCEKLFYCRAFFWGKFLKLFWRAFQSFSRFLGH